MTPVQENLFELLQEIDQICKKHGIVYYLAGGTALGAVRNEGFLPWDDDMDLYITRENWIRLEKVIDQELKPDRAIASVLRNDLYQNPIVRYVNKNTTTIYRSQALAGAACGQHVEFLIMDPVPRDPDKKKEFRELLLVYTELLTSYFVVNRQVIRKDSSFNYKTFQYYLNMMEKQGRKETLALLESKIFQYRDSDDECDDYCLRWGLRILMYHRKNFGKPRYVSFEGYQVPVGCNAEGIFREAYGNTWMMIPETQEQETHDSLHSLSMSYTNYISDYMLFMNKEEALKNYWEYKKFRMELLMGSEQNTVNRLKLTSVKHKMHYEGMLQRCGICLSSLFAQGRYDELRIVLQYYYQAQLSGDLMKWGILIPVDPEIIHIAAMLLIIDGKYAQAIKILKLCELNHVQTSSLEQTKAVATAVRNLSIAIYDDKSMQNAELILNQWYPEYPDILDFKRADLMLSIHHAVSDQELGVCVQKAQKLICQYPQDGEFYKLLGDCYAKMDNHDRTVENYLMAGGKTRNGIILHFMKQRLKQMDVSDELIAQAFTL